MTSAARSDHEASTQIQPRAARPQIFSGPSSTATSPLSSRDPSPARLYVRPAASLATKNRPALPTSTPTADPTGPTAALKRALSASNVSELPDLAKIPRPVKSASISISADSTPRWPVSPRLKSPPPQPPSSSLSLSSGEGSRSRSRASSLRNHLKKPECSAAPTIVVQSSSPAPVSRLLLRREEPLAGEVDEPSPSIKLSSRTAGGLASKLETVQESSLPTTPGFDQVETQSSDEEPNDIDPSSSSSSRLSQDVASKQTSSFNNNNNNNNNSGSDGGLRPKERAMVASQRVSSLSSQPSLSSLTIKHRADPPLRNMTVETETVPSVAQTAMVNSDRSVSARVDSNLRLKSSNETIRPRKDRKAAKRKTPSIHSGTVSSKADVFEQKVANAVDEANSSDSDATFIYESNPPEPHTHRSRQHHHSRTPSMTSMSSMVDTRLAARDSHRNPNKKSSMKFINSFTNPTMDGDFLDPGDGMIRGGSGQLGLSGYHHIARHGQGRGPLNHLVHDADASATAQLSRARGLSPRQPSLPSSPRFHTFHVGNGHSDGGATKRGEYSAYDMDGENVADDEQTPLLSSGRTARVRTPRRRNSLTVRELERRHRNPGGWCRRFAGCLVLSILLLVVVFSFVGLIFATTKPLISVTVREIQNVVASQQEIIMDLVVDAVNPNIIGVTVSHMDVTIFAKSRHVGSDTWWREHGNGPSDNTEHWTFLDPSARIGDQIGTTPDGVDRGTDPVEAEPRIMTLGHVSHFDAPLHFDGSFFHHRRVESIGEIRLSHPGNLTEAGGTERWEEVLQYPFELIVRGNFEYTLPFSTQENRVSITASFFYDPEVERKKFEQLQRGKSAGHKKKPLYSVPLSSSRRYDYRLLMFEKPR